MADDEMRALFEEAKSCRELRFLLQQIGTIIDGSFQIF